MSKPDTTEEKIEEILDTLFIEETKYKVNVAQSSTVSNTVPYIRSSPEYSAVSIVGKEAVKQLLSTLIQKEREEALLDFARWLYAPTVDYDYSNLIKKYLSQTKGGKEEKIKEFLTCSECGKSDETVTERECGYSKEIYNGIVMEIICDACEYEHLRDI